MNINGTEILPGEHKQIQIEIEKLPTHTVIDMPVWVFRSDRPGPTLLITAALHGDETNGTEILRRMIVEKTIVPDVGTVIALPVVNVYGFIHRTRALPDGKDMNRSFPGSKKGSLARRLAHVLMNQILPHADIGLDLHTGGANRTNFPQIRLAPDSPELMEMAVAFGAPFIVESGLIDASFRKEASKKGKPVLVYEAGESMRFDEQAIAEGQAGIGRLMHHLGMRWEAAASEGSILLQGRTWLRAPTAGLFRAMVKAGDKVEKKQVLGTVSDPYGELDKTIRATRDAYIIGHNNDSVVHAGSALFHLGWGA